MTTQCRLIIRGDNSGGMECTSVLVSTITIVVNFNNLGSVSMALFSADSSLTHHLAPFLLNAITTSRPFILPLVVFPKALFSTLYSSSCTLPLSVLWSLPFPLTTTFMQMTLSSSSLSTQSTLTQSFLTFKVLFNRSLPGWLLIFLLLNSSKTEFLLIGLKKTTCQNTSLHLTPLTVLEILASSLTNILPSLTKLHLSPKPVTITFVNTVSGLTSICQLPAERTLISNKNRHLCLRFEIVVVCCFFL